MSRSIAVRDTARVSRIDLRPRAYDWPFARDEHARIDAHWAQAQAEKPGLFDGRVLMARDLAVADDALTGTVADVGYKPFLCWRDFGFPGDELCNLFAMPALRASDGAFLLGRMSAGTANAGRLYFPCGTPEPADLGPDGRVDLDSNILRELAEETGLLRDDVALDATWTIVFAGPHVACLKSARAALPAADLQARFAAFNAVEADPELDALVAVRGPADLDAARMPPFMLHYLAAAFA